MPWSVVDGRRSKGRDGGNGAGARMSQGVIVNEALDMLKDGGCGGCGWVVWVVWGASRAAAVVRRCFRCFLESCVSFINCMMAFYARNVLREVFVSLAMDTSTAQTW
jgi:hypothetical protein